MADLRRYLLTWLDAAYEDTDPLSDGLTSALRRVVLLHRPVPVPGPKSPWCTQCASPVGTVRKPAWPCPTVLAIAEELKVSPDG